MAMQYSLITSSTTWIAPLLTTGVIVVGAGGGGGGGCSYPDFYGPGQGVGGGGGGGAMQQMSFVPVTALATYNITIGAGGAGGVSSGALINYNGLNGSPTTFSSGSSTLFYAPGAAGAGDNSYYEFNHGGFPWPEFIQIPYIRDYFGNALIPGSGGGQVLEFTGNGRKNFLGHYLGGAADPQTLTTVGSGGGGAGPKGNGGAGGTTGSPNGQSASANTGAGGGGGNTGATAGGNGGSGYLWIIW